MSERVWKIEDASARETLQLLQALLRDFRPRNFAVELWDGMAWPPEENQFCRFTWKIKNSRGLRAIISSSNRQLALAEQYILDNFDIIGDMEAVFSLADYLIHKEWSAKDKLRLVRRMVTLRAKAAEPAHHGARLRGRQHAPARDRQAIAYHYDVSDHFFALWLDQNMVYSAAYFEHPDESLDTAQARKLDSICHKLHLKAGERLLDIGCGWGGLIIHAAQNYGVHALGITLSREQLELAQQRIREAGLDNRCEVRLLDYRDLNEVGAFEKVVSVGMVEHVGELNLPTYFAHIFRLLRPGGLLLNSGIARTGNRAQSSQPTFTDVYVFPDGELETIGNLVDEAEKAGFELRDAENLREHYYLTTLQWLRRLEAQARAAREIVGERTYRIWRLYLGGSAYYFQKGFLNLFQSLFVKADSGRTGLPLGKYT